MAELAASAFAALSSTFAASATAATTTAAASAAATGAAAGSAALGTLQTVATIGSMASLLVGGVAAYQDSRAQARFADLSAEGERLEAEERSLRIRRELVQKVGAARVGFAASGLDIGGAGAIEDAMGADAGFEIGLAQRGGEYRAAGGRAQASAIRSRGAMSLVEAAGRAGGKYVDYRIDIARRG